MPELSVASVEAFIRANHAWAAAAALGLCLVRSTVIVGLFVPATAILVAIGGLVGAGLVGWYELVLAGVLGCTLGDHLSFWVGRGLGPGARKVWPLRTRPEIVAKGEAFFLKHGWWGVFVARFFTPLRVSVPTCAGILGMPAWAFAVVSLASASVFVPLALAPGALLVAGAEGAAQGQIMTILPVLLLFSMPVGLALLWLISYRRRHAAEIEAGPPRG